MRGDWGEFTREEFGEYAATVNKEVLIIPMIETLEALSNLEDIVSVPGVDVALIGPLDLSISLGMPQDFLNPKYQAALDKVIEICEKAGVAPGIYNVPGGQTPDDFIARGFRVFTLPWERWATAGIKDGLSKIDR
jgi:2-keto-3-deoxy-L-rhamnonate aldolase RhmA